MMQSKFVTAYLVFILRYCIPCSFFHSKTSLVSYTRPYCSNFKSGDMRTRTADILLAKQALYQLSYTPIMSLAK